MKGNALYRPIVPCLLLLLAFILFLVSNTREDPGYAEILSLHYAQFSLPDMISYINENWADAMPPLYFILNKALVSLAGPSLLLLRAASACWCCLLLLTFFLFAGKMFDYKTALTGLLLLLCNPITFSNAREIGYYAFGALMVLCAVFAFYLAVNNGQRKHWAFFGLFLLINLYTHYAGFMVIVITGSYFFIPSGSKSGAGQNVLTGCRQKVLPYLVIIGLVLLLYIPWLPGMFRQIRYLNIVPSFEPITWQTPFNVIQYFFTSRFGYKVNTIVPASYLALLTMLILFFGLYPLIRHRVALKRYLFLLFAFFLPVILLALFSLIFFPVVNYRHFFLYFPFLILLLARSFQFIKSKALKYILLAGFLLAFVPSIYHVYTIRFNGPALQLVMHIKTHRQPAEPIITGDKTAFLPLYHFLPENQNIYHYTTGGIPNNERSPVSGNLIDTAQLEEILNAAGSFWIVTVPWNDDILWDTLQQSAFKTVITDPPGTFSYQWSWIRYKVFHCTKAVQS